MSTRNSTPVNQPAGVDLRTKEGCLGKLVSGLAAVCTVLGERADFIIGNTPNIGEATDMYVEKIVDIKVGAVPIAIGVEVTTDANGLGITAVSTNIVRARALEAGVVGQSIRCLWVDAYAKP